MDVSQALAGSGGGGLANISQAQLTALLSNYRLTPATLFAKLDQSWIPAPWLQYLALEIARAIKRGNCGLLVSAPPRHGKSRLLTTATPIWALENFPSKNVVVATYGEELSTDFSREIRDFIQNNPDVLNVRLRADAQRVSNMVTTEGGGLKAVGLRGAITGRGANVFVLDDYIKEPKEAMSPTYLEDLWTWYQTVARTRLEPGAVVIIVATRWVQNDIHGRIERLQAMTGRDFFKIIKLPAIAGEGDIIGREPGEVLFPQRYTKEAILEIKTDVGSRWFEAMFQQNPLGDENAVVSAEWFRPLNMEAWLPILEEASKPHLQASRFRWGRYWDFASTKNGGDYTSGTLALWDSLLDHFYIVDISRGQWSPAKAEAAFQTAAESDYRLSQGLKLGMEEEPGSSGKYSARHFQKLLSEKIKGKTLHASKATTSKLLNAQPLLAAAEAGKVFMVEGHWNSAFIEEVTTFPESAHDDQMDSTSGCFKLLTGKKPTSASWGRSKEVQQIQQTLTDVHGNPLSTAPTTRRMSATFGRNSPSLAHRAFL